MHIKEIHPDGRSNNYTYCSKFVKKNKGFPSIRNARSSSFLDSTVVLMRDVFLPKGYPASVSVDYLEYQIWDSFQALCSSVSHTLATHATLKGLGVGDSTATAASATTVWILREGCGMISNVVFAWLQAFSLDADCKAWRICADIVCDISILLQLLAPLFPNLFLFLTCLSSIFGAVVHVAGNTTRAAFRVHQSFGGQNMADVCAKDAAQEQMVNLLGLIIAYCIVPFIAASTGFVWMAFTCCMVLHIFCNIKAVRCLQINTLNQARLKLLIEAFDKTEDMSLKSVNHKESIWFVNVLLDHSVKLGSSFQTESQVWRPPFPNKSCPFMFSSNGSCIFGHINQTATSDEILLLAFIILSFNKGFRQMLISIDDNQSYLEKFYLQKTSEFPKFRTSLLAGGWNVNSLNLLICDSWRYDISEDINTLI